MNKEEFVSKIAEKTGFTKKDTKTFLEDTIDILEEVLAEKDGEVNLVGFGKFGSREVGVTTGVSKMKKDANGNPIEEPWTKEAHKQPFFKAGKGLKDKINL